MSNQSELAVFDLTDAEMKKRHGWTRSSNMPSRYVHLVDSDVEEKILNHYGIDETSSKETTDIKKLKFLIFIIIIIRSILVLISKGIFDQSKFIFLRNY